MYKSQSLNVGSLGLKGILPVQILVKRNGLTIVLTKEKKVKTKLVIYSTLTVFLQDRNLHRKKVESAINMERKFITIMCPAYK